MSELPRTELVFEALLEEPGMSPPEIGRKIGAHPHDVAATLVHLYRTKRVTRREHGRTYRYWPQPAADAAPAVKVRPRRKKRERVIARAYKAPIQTSPCRTWTKAAIGADHLAGTPRDDTGESRRRVPMSQITLFIADHPGCTAKQVARGVNLATIGPVLTKLTKRGSITRRRVAHGEYRYWCGNAPPTETETET